MLLRFPQGGRVHGRASTEPAERFECIAPNDAIVIPLTRRAFAKSARASQWPDGIELRARQLLTVEEPTPSAVATAPVLPKASITSSTESIATPIVRKMRTSQEFAEREKLREPMCAGIQPMSDSVKMIARRLVRTREALGLGGRGGQSQFCEQIKVDKNVYNPFEKGNRRITLNVAIKIRERFGVSLDWIYCGDPRHLDLAIYQKLSEAA